MSILRVHRPFSFLGYIGRFGPFHLSHKLCTMKIYTSAVFCKNIGCFSPTSAVLTQTSAVFVRTSAALTQTSAILTPTSAVLALHRPFSTTSAVLTSAVFDFRHRPFSTILFYMVIVILGDLDNGRSSEALDLMEHWLTMDPMLIIFYRIWTSVMSVYIRFYGSPQNRNTYQCFECSNFLPVLETR